MRKEAASAGFCKSPWASKHPVLQLPTIEDLLKGKKLDSPPLDQVSVTFRKSTKAKGKKQIHPGLPFKD